MDAQKIDWRFNNHARGPHGFALGKGVPGTVGPVELGNFDELSSNITQIDNWDSFVSLSRLLIFDNAIPVARF